MAVELKVRHELGKIVEALDAITKQAKMVSDEIEKAGQAVGEGVDDQTKKTETFLNRLAGFSRRAGQQMKNDFKSIFGVEALQGALKINSQFKGSLEQTLQLNDAIRKYGGSFGLAQQNFSRFQKTLTQGLGEIGISSDVAAATLKGLMGSGVKGENNVLQYSKVAGRLGQISGEDASGIGGGIAKLLRARGMDVNNTNNVRQVGDDLRKVFKATGMSPTEQLSAMTNIFQDMASDFRKVLGTGGLSSLAAASQAGGPNSTLFLQEYLKKGSIARMSFEAQGGKDLVGENGLDVEKFRKFSQSILGRIGFDPRAAAQTLGLSEDAAEGFVRLAQSLDKVASAQERIKSVGGSMEGDATSAMGFAESFRANVNRVKAMVATPLSYATQKGSDALGAASQSNAGSLAVVGGAAGLAALLGGFGMRAIGKGLGGMGGMAAGAGLAAATGATPVYVVNASDIGGGGIAGILGGKGKIPGVAAAGLGLMGKAGLYGGALALGVGAGHYVGKKMGFDDMNAPMTGLDKLIYSIGQMFTERDSFNAKFDSMGGGGKMIVELNKQELKISPKTTRGGSF